MYFDKLPAKHLAVVRYPIFGLPALFPRPAGLWFREWQGAGPATLRVILPGNLAVNASPVVVGLGDYLAA